MSAARTIYRLAGVWNEHWGRIKTIAFWLFGAGAVSLVVGGFLVNRYGAIGAVAIIIGSLCLLGALAAFLIQRFANRRQPNAELRKLYGLEESNDPLPPTQVAPLRLRGTRTYPLSEPTAPVGHEEPPDDPRTLLGVKFRYDEKGWLRIGVGNAGNELTGVAINLLAPRRYERQYVNRVDPEKNQLITSGPGHCDETPHQLTEDAPMSVRWMETGLRINGHMVTEMTFFMPYFEGDPIYFKLGGDSLGGWTDDLIAITPPTLAGSKATKEFFPQGQESSPAAASSEESPRQLAEHLLAEFTARISAIWAGKIELSNEPGSGDVDGANALLRKSRPILGTHYPDQMSRVNHDIPEGASEAKVVDVLSEALPAIHGFLNKYPE